MSNHILATIHVSTLALFHLMVEARFGLMNLFKSTQIVKRHLRTPKIMRARGLLEYRDGA